MRGYFGIGVFHSKTSANIGTLLRSAYIMGASFVFTINRRYRHQCSDTMKSPRHIPLWHFNDWEDFIVHSPHDCQIVCVEMGGDDIKSFKHPERAVYILGAEDHGLPPSVMAGRKVISLNTPREFSLNVSVAGSIVLFDRMMKGRIETGRSNPSPLTVAAINRVLK